MDKQKKYRIRSSESPPELEISPADEHKLTVYAALDYIHDGDLTKEEAMEAYGVSEEDLAYHLAGHQKIQDV